MKKILKGLPGYFSLIGQSLPADRPAYLMMNFETACGYACPKCCLPGRQRPMGQPLSFDDRQRTLDLAKTAGTRVLVIIGAGEPTQEPGFSSLLRPVIEYTHSLGMETIMFTTLSQLIRSQAQFFLEHNVALYVSLDSLNADVYRLLTGVGNLPDVLNRLRLLREAYAGAITTVGETCIVRLGVNTCVCLPNVAELERIREFAGGDMHFVANRPMRRGRFGNGKIWRILVGDKYDVLSKRAQEMSETGGPTSTEEGVCSYSAQGTSVDVDGELLVCCYAGETAGCFGNIRQITSAEDLLQHFRNKQERCQQFFETQGQDNPCPLRDRNFAQLVTNLQTSPFRIV